MIYNNRFYKMFIRRDFQEYRKKILHKQDVNAIQNVIKKVNQLCNYESFDKKKFAKSRKIIKKYIYKMVIIYRFSGVKQFYFINWTK